MKKKRPLDKYISLTSPQTSDDELEITTCTQHKLKLLNISIEKRKKNIFLMLSDFCLNNS